MPIDCHTSDDLPGKCNCGKAITKEKLEKEIPIRIIDACNKGDIRKLNQLLDIMFVTKKVNNVNFVYDNKTPLGVACYNGNFDIAKLLLDNEADVNLPDDLNNTPLHRACEGFHLEIVKLLLDHGAEKYCEEKECKKKECKENAYGYTIEELANECDDPEKKAAIIELLKD